MKNNVCGTGNWFYGLIGILFVIVGYLLWSGSWTLDQGVGAVIILIGIKKIGYGCGHSMVGKKK